MNYKEAGVDVEAGYKAVELMKKHVKKTYRDEVITDLGGFGGLFSLASHSMEQPVLVSGTDGVGTKLKIAFLMDQHDTVGQDLVAMCVNDIICSGAEPLFFLDYIACGKNKPEKIEQIVKGIAQGCQLSGAALIGGETAEMPGFYDQEEYDLAGFAVGIVDQKKIIDGKDLEEGDQLIGLASSGIHSNGYSLVRKIFEPSQEKMNIKMDQLDDTLGQALLRPTKIYVDEIKALKNQVHLKAISHITGGGFIENIPRMLPQGLAGEIYLDRWDTPPIFKVLADLGRLQEKDLYNTFNMGIGMVVAVAKDQVAQALKVLDQIGSPAYHIGQVVKGEDGLILCTK